MVRTVALASLSLILGIGGTLGVQHFTVKVDVTQPIAVSCPEDPALPTAEQEAIDKAMRSLDLDYVPRGRLIPFTTPDKEDQ